MLSGTVSKNGFQYNPISQKINELEVIFFQAPLRGELQETGGKVTTYGDGFKKLCVDWSSEEEFVHICDIVEDAEDDPSTLADLTNYDPSMEVFNLQCTGSLALTECPDSIADLK